MEDAVQSVMPAAVASVAIQPVVGAIVGIVFAVLVAVIVGIAVTGDRSKFMAALAGLRALARRGHLERGPSAIKVWLRRMGIARQEREDLAQEILAQALRSWPTFDPSRGPGKAQTNFVLWLNAIARNVIGHHRERAHHRREVLRAEPIGSRVVDPALSVHEQIEGARAREATLELLRHVPFRDRMLIVGHDIDGVPLAELAAQLGVSGTKVCRYRRAALQRLQKRPSRRRGAELAAWLAARRAWRG